MSILLNWNGEDIPDEVRKQMPEELRRLPRGRYVLEPLDEVPELTDDEEAGIQAAMDSVRAGKGVSLDEAKARVGRILGQVRIDVAPEALDDLAAAIGYVQERNPRAAAAMATAVFEAIDRLAANEFEGPEKNELRLSHERVRS